MENSNWIEGQLKVFGRAKGASDSRQETFRDMRPANENRLKFDYKVVFLPLVYLSFH